MVKAVLNKISVRTLFLLLLLLTTTLSIHSQNFTDTNLPIVLVTTDIDPNTNLPLPILDDPRILASMKIIKRPDGTRNYLTDQNTAVFLDYDGRISIEIRGSSSQDLPKKAYGFTTLQADNVSNNNVSLLGMPSENDWILNALAFDPSLIRDYLSYNLARQLGEYATRTEFCEVLLNGEYVGLYLLQEKIKADKDRVNILKITTQDVSLPNISGGYITKTDKTTGGDPVAWTMPSYVGQSDFIHDLPQPADVTVGQNDYIHGKFTDLATSAQTNNTSLTTGYPSIIDVPSFIDFMILNELSSNVDGYQLSTYFHQDRNGKLRAGPIWDFNLTYGNDLFIYGLDRSKTNVWQFSNGDNEGPTFWRDLFNEPNFKCYWSKRWNQLILSDQPLKHSNLVILIDNTVNYISEATVRENAKWGTIPNHAAEIFNLKVFLYFRTNWISSHIGSFSACNAVTTPALVIDKINFNPATSSNFPVSNDLEFIEIKNTGATTINLTGIYFKELGITFKFPANSTITASQTLYLASNLQAFQLKYGVTAFDQFTRNLSNSSQKLVLADAFGNIIDTVEYHDSSPWPDADGNGNYLKLIDTALDNSLASSWTAASDEFLSKPSFRSGANWTVYPNPVGDILSIHGDSQITKIKLYDVLGNLMFDSVENSATVTMDFSRFPRGVYFLVVTDNNESVYKKIIKN